MATIKSYTSLEQSKKLAEILPIESADMQWLIDDLGEPFPFPVNDKVNENEEPCWSLGALLSVLPSATLDSSNDHYYRLRCMGKCTEWYGNAIDDCYEMIIKLHELNLL